MSRILLLLPFLLWSATPPSRVHISSAAFLNESILFLAMYVLLVLGMSLWSRALSRRIGQGNLRRSMSLFNKVMFGARFAVPAWFAVGLYLLDWKQIAGPMNRWPVQLPGTLLGALPAIAAWIGLSWAQYPVDRAMREQSMLSYLEENLPLHPPPTLKDYLLSNLRIQLLFMLVPVICIFAARDVVIGSLTMLNVRTPNTQVIEAIASLVAATNVFLFAPEILRRVLQTEPLPPSPLRSRLEAICRRFGLRFRDILLWQTQNNMGNAAVMGIIPQVRYILLSDLLLESMSDEQIEAVFAHEVGHVVHKHMAWFVVFFVLMFSILAVIGAHIPAHMRYANELMLTILIVLIVALFGYLSRKFERQADVFAARTIESMEPTRPPVATISGEGFVIRQPLLESPPPIRSNDENEFRWHVGPHGAAVFASVLQRVAVVNNIPIAGWNWSHGSIAKRMAYLKRISASPALTVDFDRLMFRVYVALLTLLSMFGVWAVMQMLREG